MAHPDDAHSHEKKSGACPDCGNSPVPHSLAFVMNSLTVVLGEAWVFLFAGRPSSGVVGTTARTIKHKVDQLCFRVWELFGAVKFSHDVSRAASYRSQVVWEEANARGIKMEQAIFFGRFTDMYRAFVRDQWFYFESLPIPHELIQDGYAWIDDKTILKRALRRENIPVPVTRSVFTMHGARAALREFGTVTVKPRNGSRGRHTTTNVRTEEDLMRALRSAQKLCFFVSIEQNLSGSVCRATVVGGVLVGFLQAFAPCIVGDGVSTIAMLIDKKNKEKHARIQEVVLSREHDAFLGRLQLSRDSILAKGEEIYLTHRTGRLFGGETKEMLRQVHPKLRDYMEHAGRVARVPVVGFDLMIVDPQSDPDTQEWGIIEANGLPFIDLHYLPLYGEPSKVAGSVWDLWDVPHQNLSR